MSAKRKPTRKPRPVPAGELREELALRRERARFERQCIRGARVAQKAMLTYAAADKGRRNKDWNRHTSGISADRAIIPDAPTLNGRARQMARDSWVIESAVSSYSRNVVGCGIVPVPQARDDKGNLLADVNRKAMGLFWEWAGDRKWCDSEEDQTFWQMEALAESERATVGEAFWVWSYRPNLTAAGKIDLRQPVGLKIQQFEPEQLDETVQSYEGNEVRGGLELDAYGRTVAYHLYTRNPNDFATRWAMQSVRVPADRVIHYYRKKRVRQKRGVTDLAPILQDARDLTRHKEANLYRAIMEACIGATVKRDATVGGGGPSLMGAMPRMSGDTGTTPSGVPTVDFIPGGIFDGGPGVTLEPYIPTTPGNQYEPFQRQTLRGIAAGAGLSYGQVSRDFTQGTYSGQRQEMLEDRKVFEPLQEMMAHNLLFPIYRVFFSLCVAEGRLAVDGFEADPMRYTAAEYVAPPPTWIDPKAEAEALEKLLNLRVITREEIAQMRGMRLVDIFDKLASEKSDAEKRGLELPEERENAGDAFKREMMQALAEDDKASTAVANAIDIEKLIDETGLPRDKGFEVPYLSNLPPPPANPVTAKPQPEDSTSLASAVPAEVVGYKDATDAGLRCGTCKYFAAGKCSAYAFPTDAAKVCLAWEAGPDAGRRSTDAPGVLEGEREMDDPRGNHMNEQVRGVSGD